MVEAVRTGLQKRKEAKSPQHLDRQKHAEKANAIPVPTRETLLTAGRIFLEGYIRGRHIDPAELGYLNVALEQTIPEMLPADNLLEKARLEKELSVVDLGKPTAKDIATAEVVFAYINQKGRLIGMDTEEIQRYLTSRKTQLQFEEDIMQKLQREQKEIAKQERDAQERKPLMKREQRLQSVTNLPKLFKGASPRVGVSAVLISGSTIFGGLAAYNFVEATQAPVATTASMQQYNQMHDDFRMFDDARGYLESGDIKAATSRLYDIEDEVSLTERPSTYPQYRDNVTNALEDIYTTGFQNSTEEQQRAIRQIDQGEELIMNDPNYALIDRAEGERVIDKVFGSVSSLFAGYLGSAVAFRELKERKARKSKTKKKLRARE